MCHCFTEYHYQFMAIAKKKECPVTLEMVIRLFQNSYTILTCFKCFRVSQSLALNQAQMDTFLSDCLVLRCLETFIAENIHNFTRKNKQDENFVGIGSLKSLNCS